MKNGQGFASTWKDIKEIAEADGAFQFRPGYWENVFRTNTQTAYTAGKLMQYRNNPPPAWRLMVVEDSRTSDICRALVHGGKTSIAMASDHPFWNSIGFPPYHFQCRTGLQAVSKSEIEAGAEIENPSIQDMQFKPMKGFGGNPLEKDWWDLTDSMRKRAKEYGIYEEFQQVKSEILPNKKKNVIINEDKIAEALHEFESSIMHKNHEEAAFINKDGKVLHKAVGKNHEVDFPLSFVKNNISTHNHPTDYHPIAGTAFSVGDIDTFIKGDGYRVRAITRKGHFVQLERGTGKLDKTLAEAMIKEGFDDTNILIKRGQERAFKNGGSAAAIDRNKVMKEIIDLRNEWMAENAPNYGYIFTKGEI